MTAWQRFVREHDDRRSFVVAYIALALVLSIWISLFWLVAVVSVHVGLELGRHQALGCAPGRALKAALWETKLDWALVLFALVVSVYIDTVLGLVGLGSAARLSAGAARGGARFLSWKTALRTALLSADDAAQVVRAIARRSAKSPQSRSIGDTALAHTAAHTTLVDGHGAGENATGAAKSLHPPEPWRQSWALGDKFAVTLGAAAALLLGFSPWLTASSVSEIAARLLGELHPWP